MKTAGYSQRENKTGYKEKERTDWGHREGERV